MAIVKVCDFCGEKLPTIMGGYSPSVRYQIKKIGLMSKEYDLCSDCVVELTKWIKAKTEKARRSDGHDNVSNNSGSR